MTASNEPLNLLVRDQIGQAITTQQVAIPRTQHLLLDVHFKRVAGANGPGDNVFQGVMFDLFGSDNAAAQLLLDQRMVFRKLTQLSAAELVDPAISHMGPERCFSPHPERNDCRSHA